MFCETIAIVYRLTVTKQKKRADGYFTPVYSFFHYLILITGIITGSHHQRIGVHFLLRNRK